MVPLCPSAHSCTTHVSNSPNGVVLFLLQMFGLSVLEHNRNCAVFSLPERNRLKLESFVLALESSPFRLASLVPVVSRWSTTEEACGKEKLLTTRWIGT